LSLSSQASVAPWRPGGRVRLAVPRDSCSAHGLSVGSVDKVTSRLVRCLGALALLLEAGCGVAAPDISVAASCTLGGIPVLVEEGVRLGPSPAASCKTSSDMLGEYRDTFEEGWGAVALQDEGWTVRVRAGSTVDSEGHTGVTYHHSRIVDVA